VGAIHPDFEGLTLEEAIALVGKMHHEWDRKTETNSVPRQSSATIDQNRPAGSDSDAWTDDEDQNDGTAKCPRSSRPILASVPYTKASGKAPSYDSQYPNRVLLAELAKARAARKARKAAKQDTREEAPPTDGLLHRFVNVTADEGAQQSIFSSTYPIDARNVWAGRNARQ
jgi:hypothetical protein